MEILLAKKAVAQCISTGSIDNQTPALSFSKAVFDLRVKITIESCLNFHGNFHEAIQQGLRLYKSMPDHDDNKTISCKREALLKENPFSQGTTHIKQEIEKH